MDCAEIQEIQARHICIINSKMRQDAPFFADEASMKVFFEKLNVKRAGKAESKNDYSPVKGDFISN